MIKNVLLLIPFLCLTNCTKKDKKCTKQDVSVVKKEVNSLLNNWHKSATEANYNNYFKVMDSSSVFIGTDAKEVWSKKQFQDFSKPYFDKGKAWDFKVLERNIYPQKIENIIWFDELLDTWMGICRGSGVLEKRDNKWTIQHYVLSVTIPNEDVKPVVAIKQKKDSLFLLKYKK